MQERGGTEWQKWHIGTVYKKGGNKNYVLDNYIFLWISGFFSKSLEVLHEGTYAFQLF
jgi:hypothetical protein